MSILLKSKINWSNSLRKELLQLENCYDLMSSSEFRNELPYANLIDKIEEYFNRLQNANFQISFVGTIKAGKSTLINALLGGNFATVNVTPETAVLTKFFSSNDNSYHIHISFYTETEWGDLWADVEKAIKSKDQDIKDRIKPFLDEYNSLNAQSIKSQWLNHETINLATNNKAELSSHIANYTSSKSAVHYFVKEVSVEIKDCPLPAGVVLCDTPGLDDVLSYRSNITKKYIISSNAVFICVLSKFLGGEQYNIIQQVFSQIRYNPERIYIIGTQTDIFEKPLTDWQLQKEEWIKYFATKSGFGSRELAQNNILGISAGIYLFLLRNQKYTPDSDELDDLRFYARKYLCLDRRSITNTCTKLRESTGIDFLWSLIKKNIFSIYRETLENHAMQEMNILKDEIILCMNEIIQSQELKIAALDQDLAKLDENREALEAAIDTNLDNQAIFQQEFNRLEQATNQAVSLINGSFSHLLD